MPHEGVYDRLVGGLQSGQPSEDGEVGIASHEWAGLLRGSAGEDDLEIALPYARPGHARRPYSQGSHELLPDSFTSKLVIA